MAVQRLGISDFGFRIKGENTWSVIPTEGATYGV
jgi:hypothetical protein